MIVVYFALCCNFYCYFIYSFCDVIYTYLNILKVIASSRERKFSIAKPKNKQRIGRYRNILAVQIGKRNLNMMINKFIFNIFALKCISCQYAIRFCVLARATGNSRFETEKSPRSAKNSHCLSNLIITVSAIPARFIWPAFPM